MISRLILLSFPIWSALWQPPWVVRTSDFDPVFQHIARREGHDWRLVSAIACAESRYDPEVVSHAGAIGLMQVMPDVAERLDTRGWGFAHPLANVELGVAHLNEIAGVLRFPRLISERDRLSIVLAAYNSGLWHVLDARRLALKYGENYNSWAVVAHYLELLSQPEYFEDAEFVKAGRFDGAAETANFVARAWSYYEQYCSLW